MENTLAPTYQVEYSAKYLNEHCGEVYCSQNLNSFIISCIKCSQDFDLFSGSLFVQHFKECSETLGEPDFVVTKWDDSEGSDSSTTLKPEYLIETSDHSLENEDNATVDSAGQECTKSDNVLPQDAVETDPTEQPAESNEDPLDVDEEENFDGDNKQNQSAQLERRHQRHMITEAIIHEYKKYPAMWDDHARQLAPKGSTTRSLHKIVKAVNSKFNSQFTHQQIRYKIRNIRLAFTKACKKLEELETFENNIDPCEILWFFNKIKFVDPKPRTIKEGNSTATNEMQLNLDDSSEFNEDSLNTKDNSNEDNSCASEDDKSSEAETNQNFGSNRRRFTRKQTTIMINLFKACPHLYDINDPLYKDNGKRKESYKDIVSKLGRDHDIICTSKEYCYQIRYMRATYALHLRRVKAGKPSRVPWFFSRMSFLEPFSEPSSRVLPPKISEDVQFLTENKPLMIEFIKHFKESGCLWDVTHKDWNSVSASEQAYVRILNMFLEWDCLATKTIIRSAITLCNAVVAHAKRIRNSDNSPLWFYEHLKFLENAPRYNKFCSHCNKTFKNVAEWETHKLDIGEHPYKCDVCNIGFLTRQEYNAHYQTHQEPYKCQLCDFQCREKGNYFVHIRRHNESKPFSCQYCEKAFVTSGELKIHILVHTGQKPWVCELCGKTWITKSHLADHMKKHGNKKDFKCEKCGKEFVTKGSLRYHMISHSEERRHVCETCNARFKSKKHLRQHSLHHASKKKLPCKICGKLFAQSMGLRTHMKTHNVTNEQIFFQ